MRELAELARQIRNVRDAERRFMRRWRVEQLLMGPEVLDRLADDMANAHRELEGFSNRGLESGYPQALDGSIYHNGGADGDS